MKASRPRRLSIRQGFAACFVLLLLVQAVVISVFFLMNSHSRTIASTEVEMLDYVEKNRILTDTMLESFRQKIKSLNVDTGLYDFLQIVDQQGYTSGSINVVNGLINHYFWDLSDHIVSANLVSSEYSSVYENFAISREALYERIPDLDEQKPEFLWFPDEIMEDWGSYIQATQAYSGRRTEVVLLVRRLNPSIVQGSTVHVAGPGIEKPVLVVAVSTGLYSGYFQGWEPEKYLVVTPEGGLVAGAGTWEPAEQPEWFRDALAKGSGSGIYQWNGRESIVCFATSEVNQWILAGAVPIQEATAETTSYMTIVWVVIAVNAAVIIAAALLVSRRVTQPFQDLVGWTERISQGDFSQRTDIKGGSDISAISETINQLNQWLEGLSKENSEVALREQEATIAALEMQLNPHFLYNTLNIINLIAMEQGEEEISSLIVNLSGMMQYTIHTKSKFTNCSTEVEFLNRYVYLMSARFPGKYVLRTEISEEALNAIVPKMLIQPFVENAILHGFSQLKEGGEIVIRAWVRGGIITFQVQDNGMGIAPEKWERMLTGEVGHIGCSNVNRRLKLIFGEDYGLQVASHQNPTIIEIRFPYIGTGAASAQAPGASQTSENDQIFLKGVLL